MHADNQDLLETALADGQKLVRLASLLTFVSGLLFVWQPLLRHFHHDALAHYVIPPNARNLADFTTVGLGLVLMMLAYELLLRKRVAWYVSLAVCLASVGSDVVFHRFGASTAFGLAAFAVLAAGNKQFISGVKEVHLRRGVLALILSIAFALAYGTVGFWLLSRRDFGFTFSFGQAFVHTLQAYSGFDQDDLIARTRYSHWFLMSLRLVGISTLLYCLYSLLRPLRYEYQTLPAERAQARALLEKYGGDTDDFFKLWPEDKSFFFSSDGKAFIAYGVASQVAIAYGGLSGRPASRAALLREFTHFCVVNGWLAAFVQADGSQSRLFTAGGYQTLAIGADAVVDLETFVTETAVNKHFRNITNRFRRFDFQTERSLPPHNPQLLHELQAVTDEWLKRPGHHEWHFFTGRHSIDYFKLTPLFVVRDATGRALAFVNELPCFKAGEATIDLMRHRLDIPSNTMDYLFLELLRSLHAQGFRQFNLGLSPLAGEQFASGLSDRLLHQLYLASQSFISTKGLNQFKNKFKPSWQPRYVYFIGGGAILPHIGLAVAQLMGGPWAGWQRLLPSYKRLQAKNTQGPGRSQPEPE